jgi:hypothetical protein
VYAAPKGNIAVIRATMHNLVRIGELFGVAGGFLHIEHEGIAFLDRVRGISVEEVGGRCCDAHDGGKRGCQTQALEYVFTELV